MDRNETVVFATDLALQAGAIMQTERENKLKVHEKPDRTLVTNVDMAIQELAIDAIHHRFPGHYIQGEERSYGSPDAQHRWTIDPLDGTGEYVLGENAVLPTYGFGLAKFYNDTLELGLFYCPSRSELYVASRGLGAFLNGERIIVNKEQIALGTAYDYCHWDRATPDTRVLEKTFGKPLNQYSAIYQACSVATGKSSFAVFPGSTVHDIAPGAIMVQEAFGKVTDSYSRAHAWRGRLEGAIYSNGVDHPKIIAALSA